MQNFNLGMFLLGVLPVLLAITVHEAAHGYVAKIYGDATAQQMGRMTLNPFKHIDPIGTVVVPLLSFMFTSFLFGWAKPVPIDGRNFTNPRMGWRMVSLAGPGSNLLMALMWGLVLGLAKFVPADFVAPLHTMAQIGIQINAMLCVLNSLPILPLDGGRFVDSFLSARHSIAFQKIEPYGTWVILFLLMSGILGKIIYPLAAMIMVAAHAIAQIF